MSARITIDLPDRTEAPSQPAPVASEPGVPELPSPTQDQPAEIPPHVQKAIAAHKNGQGYKVAFVHPELANDLDKFYGPTGHIIMHAEDQHGPLGHSHDAAEK